MPTVGIVGAGAAAAAASFAIQRAAPGVEITVLEKSGGLCGRAATRRRDGVVYDYGANYVKSDDERVVELLAETLETEGLVDVTEPVYTFDEDGVVSPGRDANAHKWSYETGLTQIAKRLFGRTDATIHRRTRVETIRRDGDRWALVDADGGSWGPFDVLCLNPPAPQTAELLREAEWDDDRRTALREAVSAVPYRTIWTAVLGYPFRLDRPYYGLVNTDKNHAVGWISREECKGGHVPDSESVLIVQANHEWSTANYGRDPSKNVAELAELAADVVGDDRLSEPAWSDHQGWRYALAEGGVARDPLAAAEAADLYCLGDWVAGKHGFTPRSRMGLTWANGSLTRADPRVQLKTPSCVSGWERPIPLATHTPRMSRDRTRTRDRPADTSNGELDVELDLNDNRNRTGSRADPSSEPGFRERAAERAGRLFSPDTSLRHSSSPSSASSQPERCSRFPVPASSESSSRRSCSASSSRSADTPRRYWLERSPRPRAHSSISPSSRFSAVSGSRLRPSRAGSAPSPPALERTSVEISGMD